MAMLKPSYALTIGAFSSANDNTVGGPLRLSVLRDMAVAADAAQIALADRSGVNLHDEVSVQMGHDGENEDVLRGTVAALRPDLLGVQVTVLGMMQRLLDLRTAAWYDNQSAGAIARDLIDQAGLEAGTIDEGPALPRYAVDKRCSGYAHLRLLADRLGFELYAKRDGKICFHGLGDGAGLDAGGGLLGAAGAVAGAASSAVGALLGTGGEGYQYGRHLLQGQAQRLAPAWGRIVVGGESPMSGQGDGTAHWLTVDDSDYLGEAAASVDTPALLVIDPAARTKDIADRFAAGMLATGQRGAHQVTIRVLGRPQVDLGDTIQVGAAPEEMLNASGYVRALHHYLDSERGFVTDLRIVVSAA
jgi:phage protein D